MTANESPNTGFDDLDGLGRFRFSDFRTGAPGCVRLVDVAGNARRVTQELQKIRSAARSSSGKGHPCGAQRNHAEGSRQELPAF
jgi:hypothetical protein